MNEGTYVRKQHVWDGSPRAGEPVGPVLQVTHSHPHRPVDGPGRGSTVCHLSDGSWKFAHNLCVVDK